jgi:histidinol dehydrogenase
LPTYGFARNYSGLSVSDFQKQLSVQELTREGLAELAPTVRTLAQLEGLTAHAQAVAVRLDNLSDNPNQADIEADRTGT